MQQVLIMEDYKMAKILTEPELRELVDEGKIIENGMVKSVEGIKYDFCLGTQVLWQVHGN